MVALLIHNSLQSAIMNSRHLINGQRLFPNRHHHFQLIPFVSSLDSHRHLPTVMITILSKNLIWIKLSGKLGSLMAIYFVAMSKYKIKMYQMTLELQFKVLFKYQTFIFEHCANISLIIRFCQKKKNIHTFRHLLNGILGEHFICLPFILNPSRMKVFSLNYLFRFLNNIKKDTFDFKNLIKRRNNFYPSGKNFYFFLISMCCVIRYFVFH